jgi:hypothetical protein
MTEELKGQLAVVTGTARGIGAARCPILPDSSIVGKGGM